MEITIIFDFAFNGRAEGAVWIVQSDENRRWFDNQHELDAESAIFTLEGGELGHDAILRAIWNVQEHYPHWTRIRIRDVVLTSPISHALRDEGVIIEMERGFALVRC